MGYTHFDKPTGVNGVYVGAVGSEVQLASATGGLYQGGTLVQVPAATINSALLNMTATAPELNKAADLSAKIQTITTAGAQVITAGVEAVYLNNATTAIAATIADASAHQGFFLIKAGLEPAGGQDHTVTIGIGSWNGTNKIATFADVDDWILVYFNAAGAGTVLINTGSVAFSG